MTSIICPLTSTRRPLSSTRPTSTRSQGRIKLKVDNEEHYNGINRYTILNTLGVGSYAIVKLANDKLTET